MYSIQAKCLVGEKKETSGMRRVVRAAAKYRLKFLYTPEAHLPYFLLREHVIDRLYDQNVGYWEANLQGLDHPGKADRGALLVDYLGLSARQIATAADRLMVDGKYAMAASLLDTVEARFPNSGALRTAKRLAYLKLMEQHQNTDPFKFIIYAGKIREQTPQINAQP
jgi:alkyl sulfatase BDS1-like metallo-beta-lactamase superfamily hydrolase